MLFIWHVVFCCPNIILAYVDLPLKNFRDGNKAAFMQAPYINTVQNTEQEEQKEISVTWPKGIVPYYVDTQCYDEFVIASIHAAMALIESDSCIRFEEVPQPPTNRTWIHITNPKKERECNHEPIFKKSGEVVLILGYDCLKYTDVLHSVLHGIGFKDEVTHPHREKYIRVLWSNILPAFRHLFRKQQGSRVFVEYDPLSVMHFHDRAFSANGRPTIMPLEPGLIILPSESLSQLDRMRLNTYFGNECNKRKVNDLMDSCKMTLQRGKSEQLSKESNENAENQYIEEYDTEEIEHSDDVKDGNNNDDDNIDVNNEDVDDTNDDVDDKNNYFDDKNDDVDDKNDYFDDKNDYFDDKNDEVDDRNDDANDENDDIDDDNDDVDENNDDFDDKNEVDDRNDDVDDENDDVDDKNGDVDDENNDGDAANGDGDAANDDSDVQFIRTDKDRKTENDTNHDEVVTKKNQVPT